MNDLADRRAVPLVPAWPTLLGVHLLVLSVVAGTWWRLGPQPFGPPTDLDQQLMSLDIDASVAAVDGAIATTSRAGALGVDAEPQERSFLSLLARSADLVPGAITFAVGAPESGVRPVYATIQVVGDAFALPAFVDGLHRQHATVQLEAIDADIAPGGQGRATVRLRFSRLAGVDTAWIRERLELHHPGADRAAPVLERAALLASWRHLAAADEVQREAAAQTRARASRELPAALVRLHRSGGLLHWTAADGLGTSSR